MEAGCKPRRQLSPIGTSRVFLPRLISYQSSFSWAELNRLVMVLGLVDGLAISSPRSIIAERAIPLGCQMAVPVTRYER